VDGVLPRLDGVRVLVVDDDTATRESLQFILEDRGAVVTAVGSAEEARAVLQGWTPDVLVGDIRLPEADGYALVRELRATERLHHLPAVAMTAYDAHGAERALAAGYQAHLVKPFEPDSLIVAIAELARRRATAN
jgi:CheY-like chemotaxis protein